ncbi:MAG: endonuclease/exonuclease/phosphatase family protein [Bacteroidales bacterium]|nr:endonuclease/exonuclease/phosphatase family protein [Bacteroidales bacterium]
MKKILKYLLLILNIIAALLYLGSTLAGVAEPDDKTLWLSLMSYGFLHLLIINVIFSLLWMMAKSKWFLLSLVVIAVRCNFLPSFFQVGGVETLTADELSDMKALKVMTFNVHRFQDVAENAELLDTNMLQFLALVDEEHPDVLSMQEYIGRGDTVQLTTRLAERGYRYQASGYQNNMMTSEVIFSKWPIVGKATLGEHTNFFVELLVGDTLRGGDTVRLYCLHLQSYRLDDSDHAELSKLAHGTMDSSTGRSTYHKFRETILAHNEEWKQIKPSLDSCHHAYIVTGDFNETPASYLYRQMNKMMKDSYREAGQGFSTTYHGEFANLRHGIYLAYRIDYVMHSASLKARSYRRVRTDISDHYPVVVTLAMAADEKERDNEH